MLTLFNNYSVTQIIIFVIILAVALKEFIVLIDFFKTKAKEISEGRQKQEKSYQMLQQMAERMTSMEERLTLLTESDKDDIKSWIVEKYHYYKANPAAAIDSFTMDTIEKRFKHYKDEGGNSYIEDLIEELREMAKED